MLYIESSTSLVYKKRLTYEETERCSSCSLEDNKPMESESKISVLLMIVHLRTATLLG